MVPDKGKAVPPPPRRPLKIYSSDPMSARSPTSRVAVDIENEQLTRGPCGRRVEVIDYDSAQECYYRPVDLDDPAILMQGGLEPAESDPHFHQQMVYAVAMKTLENFDRALGRPIFLRSRHSDRLRLLPHAFYGANAFFDPKLNAVLFGYFKADENDPGPNLPGQTVFTCLSHDIIAHEVTHAVVHRLRRRFLEPSNVDVRAFHEGFSDIVALFQHFSFQSVLRNEIQRTRGDISKPTMLVELARQFGFASGYGRALRSALDDPEARLYDKITEPHARGSVLVAAVFDAFFAVYQRRIRDLIRIATGGTGTLPEGDLHPDLVNRIAVEASASAQSVLTMCIRAFDYLPPVDITFGDYLRALITADFELNPSDEYALRGEIIEAFRRRRIYPRGVVSLAEESLLWPSPATELRFGTKTDGLANELKLQFIRAAEAFGSPRAEGGNLRPQQSLAEEEMQDEDRYDESPMAVMLHDWARANANALVLSDPDTHRIQVAGFHAVHRVSPRGRVVIELIVQFVQTDQSRQAELGGIPFRGGTTVVAAPDGRIRYVIAKPIGPPAPAAELAATAPRPGAVAQLDQRLEQQRQWTELCDAQDASSCYDDAARSAVQMAARMNFSSLHED